MEISESWMQLGTFFLANVAVILWFRTESRNDWARSDAQWKASNEKWHEEMKDFHGRLISLEERSRGLHDKRDYKPRTKKTSEG